ncbi:MAG: RNA-binding S4 domain-containing protein [Oscillospiraceae bacterium]|jgi:ribosome-associated protein|nr:RNA-binding S4 domain-containing protein [Oscillospiraceae bacterium]
MKAKVKGLRYAPVTGEYIRLDAFLKFIGEAETGGEAKHIISDGKVSVDGGKCIQRGKKVYRGSFVGYEGKLWRITGAPASDGN